MNLPRFDDKTGPGELGGPPTIDHRDIPTPDTLISEHANLISSVITITFAPFTVSFNPISAICATYSASPPATGLSPNAMPWNAGCKTPVPTYPIGPNTEVNDSPINRELATTSGHSP
jgi:hypothetical protein